MRTNLIMVVTVILVLAFAAGCNSGGGKDTSTVSPFLGGTNGILINFAPNAPPESVFDAGQYPFDIDVVLKNEGETKVNKGDVRVKISGIHPPDFGKTSADLTKNPDEDLESTKKIATGETIPGTETHVIFENLKYIASLSGNNQFPIRAEVCYKYQTLANSNYCARENMIDTTKPGACVVSEPKLVYSSRAPVQVVAFKESAMGKNKILIEFALTHDGNGRIFSKGTTCDSAIANRDKVYVKVDTGLPGLKCSGFSGGTDSEGFVKLYGDSVPVTCSQQIDTKTDFEKIVKITVDYDYQDDKTVDLIVKQSGE